GADPHDHPQHPCGDRSRDRRRRSQRSPRRHRGPPPRRIRPRGPRPLRRRHHDRRQPAEAHRLRLGPRRRRRAGAHAPARGGRARVRPPANHREHHGEEVTRREGVDLRAKLLATTPNDVNIKPSQQLPHVWAALLDIGTATGSATVAVVADGTVSMYTSTGGGMIGAGQHQVIHMPAARFLKTVEAIHGSLDVVTRAKELNMPALALTDHGALYGAIDFYVAASQAGIKPIIGVETYIARNSRFDRDPRIEGHGKPFHLVLLAKDFTGYQNLVSLVTAAHLEGYYYRPRMDKELLRAHSKGLIALSACLQGELARALLEEGIDAAVKVAHEHEEIFGTGNYFLELMDHGIPEQQRQREGMREVARRTKIPLVVTNDLHYVNAEDAEAQDVMVCIQQGKTIDTPDRLKMIDHPEIYLKSAEQMYALFPEDREALENTLRIASMVDLKLPLGEVKMPHFEVPGGLTPEQQLANM